MPPQVPRRFEALTQYGLIGVCQMLRIHKGHDSLNRPTHSHDGEAETT